jgi:hypothetical protein
VQVDPIKPMLKAPGIKLLQLKYHRPLSKFAFKFNLRCYSQVVAAAQRAGATSADTAMSRDMIAWIKAAKAHCSYVILLNFVDAMAESKLQAGPWPT